MKRKYILKLSLLITILSLLVLTGCNRQTSRDTEVSGTDTGMNPTESVLVATWEESALDLSAGNITNIIGDTIYSAAWEWNQDAGDNWTRDNVKVSRLRYGVKEAEEILKLEKGQYLIHFMADEEGSVYLLYYEVAGDGNRCFIRKDDSQGNIVYCEAVPLEQEDFQIFERISKGSAGTQGSVFFSVNGGIAYLFDGSGSLSGRVAWGEFTLEPNETIGLVNAEDRIYFYHADGSQVIMRPVDMTDASLGPEKIFIKNEMGVEETLSAGAVFVDESVFARINVFSGYQNKVLISAGGTLWEYSPETGEKEVLLHWLDKHINLRGSVEEIGVFPDGSLYVLCYDPDTGVTSQVLIQEKDKDEVKGIETIVIGYLESPSLKDYENRFKQVVAEFNQANTGYLVELRGYDYGEYTDPSFGFFMDLLQGKGPDLFDLRGLPLDMLAAKGILEDLSPYFEASEVVKESDLLPRVRDAETIGGKLVCVIPSFTLLVNVVEKGYVTDGGWTAEEYFALADKYPDGNYYMASTFPEGAFGTIMPVELESYINWEEKKCSFDSERFVELLEGVKRSWNSDKALEFIMYKPDERAEAFHNKDIISLPEIINAILDYLERIKPLYLLNGDAELAGYPNPEGKPWYQMCVLDYDKVLGMNSASDCKEGAWKFLEYIMSYEYQSGMLYPFPVRSDAFEARLEKGPEIPELVTENMPEFTDADRDLFRFMVDNAYLEKSTGSVIRGIIYEELAPFFEGDKTAREVADIIQSRVTIYLNE